MRKQIVACWLTTCLVLLAATTATAQHYQPFGELDMHYDMQWFAPPIIDEYGDEPVAPNYGWFADYSRAYLRLSRPENLPSNFEEDATWGNIWDFGYMTEDNHGWLASVTNIQSTQWAVFTPVTDIQGNAFDLRNNLNFGRYWSAELNKTFRVHVGDHGTFFEPFGGFRYGNFEEEINNETLVFDNPADPMVEVGTGTRGVIGNSMVGAQIGSRAYNRNGHWVISGELRGFAQMNFQEVHAQQIEITTNADGAGGFIVQNPVVTRVDESFDEFVVGGELRLEVAYELTREIRIHAGLEVLHMGRGLSRGFDSDLLTASQINDGGATYWGYFFGAQLNR